MSSLRATLAWIVWPALVGGALVAARAMIARGVAAPLVIVVIQGVATLCVVALERWMPEHPSWNVSRNDLRADVLHALVSGLAVSGLLRALVFVATPSLGLWPARWPVLVQLALALFVADFGNYATHVITHRVRWLWPIHAVHHSVPRLYWLNAFRMHPLDSGSTVVFSLVPLALLGAPTGVLVLFDVFAVVHLTVQHSNVRVRLGFLEHLIAGPEFHRWHHSRLPEEGEHNYASFFALWDHLFGSFRMSSHRHPPEDVGLYGGATMPDAWLAQIKHPFEAWTRRVSD